jgi:hypothetical protein
MQRLDASNAERDAAQQRETAIAEILQIINRSLRYPQSVFDAILEKAHTLCGAAHGEPVITRINQRLTSDLPQLTTMADKPGEGWLATAIGVLLVAYAMGLAGIDALPVVARLMQ